MEQQIEFKEGMVDSMVDSMFQSQPSIASTCAINRCIVEGNLSFNLLKMSCGRNMLLAFSNIGEKYSGITYNDLRIKYSKKENLNVQHKVENMKALWQKYGVTILLDGWIDTSKPALSLMLLWHYVP